MFIAEKYKMMQTNTLTVKDKEIPIVDQDGKPATIRQDQSVFVDCENNQAVVESGNRKQRRARRAKKRKQNDNRF